MTTGKRLSTHASVSQHTDVQAIEEGLRELHDALLGVQRAADDLAGALERAISEAMTALGSEVIWIEEGSSIELAWEKGDEEFGRRLLADKDQLEGLVKEFFDTGELPADFPHTVRRMDVATGEIWEWDVAESLQATRAEFLRTREDWTPDAQAARALVDESWDRVVQLIRTWVDDPPKTVTEDWGRVLRSWRKALGLTGHRAAEILGVSPPAVTRYEKGTRSPSMAYIESMAERIIGHGAEPPEEAAALFRLASMWDTPASELAKSLEASSENEHDVRERLNAVLDSLPISDIRLLLSITRNRDALSALRAVPRQDELAPLRAALGSEAG